MANQKIRGETPSVHEHVELLRLSTPSSFDLAQTLRKEIEAGSPHSRRKLHEHAAEEFLKSGEEREAAKSYEAAARDLQKEAARSNDPIHRDSTRTLSIQDFVIASILYSRSGDSDKSTDLNKASRRLADILKLSDQALQQMRSDAGTFISSINVRDELAQAV